MDNKTRSKIKKRTFFYIINSLIILFFVIFYSYRLVYYYLKQNTNGLSDQAVVLVDDLLKYISYIDLDNGLIDNDDGTYTYKGNAIKNYVMYSGRMWRIIDIDQDKNIKMIREESDTLFIQEQADKYQNAPIRYWLENIKNVNNTGIYFKSLNNQYEYMEKTSLCIDKIDNVEAITCNSLYEEDYVTLLSLNDYKKIGGSKSYLNNEEDWWLATTNSNNQYWYVASDGGIQEGKILGSSHGIRPVITIRNYTNLVSGTGTKSDPYIIENNNVNILANVSVSNYIKYSNYLWKVISKQEGKIQLALDGYIKDNEGNEIDITYGNSKFSTAKGTIGYYLNNNFYNSLNSKEYIVKSDWYYGVYTGYNKYNYKDVYNAKYNANVGLLKIGDLYVQDYLNVFLSNRPYGSNNTLVYSTTDDKTFFADFVTAKKKIRPSIYLKDDVNILKGNGTKNNPYELEVASDEK